jgi:hypothetical protein
MARSSDSDLTPGLLALGALVLGIGAVIAVWSASGNRSDDVVRGSDGEATWDGPGSVGGGGRSRVSAFTDAGMSAVPGSGAMFPVDLNLSGIAALAGDDVMDPQILAMRRSFGDDAGMAASFSPYAHRGHAVRVEGVDGVASNASCDVRVLPVQTGEGFNCVVRVRCGGVTVYPDSALAAGYAPCDVIGGVPRMATDRAPTDRDGDPELLVDLNGHTVRIHDVRHGAESTVEIALD